MKKDLKGDVRKEFRFIGPNDTIVLFRNPVEMQFGTVQIEDRGNDLIITGIPNKKNSNGNRIKYMRIIKDIQEFKTGIEKIKKEINIEKIKKEAKVDKIKKGINIEKILEDL